MDTFKSPLFVSFSKCAIGKYFDFLHIRSLFSTGTLIDFSSCIYLFARSPWLKNELYGLDDSLSHGDFWRKGGEKPRRLASRAVQSQPKSGPIEAVRTSREAATNHGPWSREQCPILCHWADLCFVGCWGSISSLCLHSLQIGAPCCLLGRTSPRSSRRCMDVYQWRIPLSLVFDLEQIGRVRWFALLAHLVSVLGWSYQQLWMFVWIFRF